MHLFLSKSETVSRISSKLKLSLLQNSYRVLGGPRRCFYSNYHLRSSTSSPKTQIEPKFVADDIEINDSKEGVETTSPELSQWGIPMQLKRELRARTSIGEIRPLNWMTEKLLLNNLPPAPEETAAVCAALQSGDPHKILDTIVNATQAPGGQRRIMTVLARIPPSAFTELLRCLNPEHFVSRHKRLHMEVSPGMSKILGLVDAMDQKGVYTFFKHFLDNINLILDVRNLRHEPIPSDFKYLLQCARATGHIEAARIIWANFHAVNTQEHHDQDLGEDEVKIDLESYNHYLGVICWHDSLKPHQRYRLRFIPRNVLPRTWSTTPYTLSGHAVEELGIKHQATRLFRQMVNSGLSGNEETFCLMMVALGREGDLAGVASILKRVWDIDVQELIHSGDIATEAGTKYSLDSPFYPSTNLLFTIAHIYGTNNAVPVALRLVDFVSRKYSLTIPYEVWNELLQWTFVLSAHDKRSAESAELAEYDKKGNEFGKLPQGAVLNLWKTMTSEPYSVTPTMEMYNRLIITLAHLQRWGEMQVYMTEALRMYKGNCSNLYQKQTLYNIANSSPRSSAPLLDLRKRDVACVAMRVARNKEYMRRWISILLLQGSRSLKTLEESQGEDFAVRAIPQLVNTWHMFLKRRVRYHVRLGVVEFGTKSEKKLRYQRLGRKFATTDSKRLEHWLGKHWTLVNRVRAERHPRMEPNRTHGDQLEYDLSDEAESQEH